MLHLRTHTRIPVLHSALLANICQGGLCTARQYVGHSFTRNSVPTLLAKPTSRQQHHKRIHSMMVTHAQRLASNNSCRTVDGQGQATNKTTPHCGAGGLGSLMVPVILENHPYHWNKQHTLRSTFRRCSVPMLFNILHQTNRPCNFELLLVQQRLRAVICEHVWVMRIGPASVYMLHSVRDPNERYQGALCVTTSTARSPLKNGAPHDMMSQP